MFEFRDRSWFDDRVYEILRRYGATLCIYELAGVRSPEVITSDLVYVRLHGPDGPYKGSYDRDSLQARADQLSDWDGSGKEVYCFFDNDEHGYAAVNARDLQDILG